ncbi:MAG: HD domain-containing protein [Candidatus Hinthialibacter sp.]
MPSDETIQNQREQAKDLLHKINHEVSHAYHVCKLSLSMFDQLEFLHHLGAQERCWLECAAYLHDIGWAISGKKHHKHSMRMLLNADMPAFSDLEKRIVGNIVRYHRKALPSPKHSSFVILDPGDQETVKKLASFLRLADGLDDTHNERISDLELMTSNGEITFRAQTDHSCPEEMNSVEKKKDLFVET